MDKDDDVDRPHPRAGSSSARDDNPHVVRHVSHLARLRETSQDSPVTQKRADPSSCEMDPSSCSKTRVTPSLSRLRVLRSLLTLVVVRERMPCAVCARSAWRCGSPCYSLALLFQRGMPPP